MTARRLNPVALCEENANCNASAVPRPEDDSGAGRMILRTSKSAALPDYYLFLPDDLDPALPPLVSVHGISRNAQEHAQAFVEIASAQRRLLIAPHFDAARFDGFQRLARGTEEAVGALWRDVEDFTGVSLQAVDMLGFSGGAQFTHRYAMLNPRRIRSQILVSAGWYTLPSAHERFPFGVKGDSRRGRRSADNLPRFLAIPTLVLVGEQDSQRDAALRRTPEIDIKQGINRIERASRWTCALLQAATRAGVTATVQFSMLPGCGHAFDDCVAKGDLVGRVSHWLQRG